MTTFADAAGGLRSVRQIVFPHAAVWLQRTEVVFALRDRLWVCTGARLNIQSDFHCNHEHHGEMKI